MLLVYIILGGVVGGGLGWLFDKATKRNQWKATDASCETRT